MRKERKIRRDRKIIDGQVYEFELIDIWSRPGAWSRQRAYIFLGINILVYAALNAFIFWIHQATLFDFSWRSYTSTYHKTLIDFLFFPISIQEAPVLIPIFGFLMATIIAVPVLVAQLYGFRYSMVFCLCVLVLGHLPVLALFLVASSFIAGVSKHRLPFKFGVALLSLLPIIVYFFVATRGINLMQFRPVEPILLYAPWFLAFLAATAITAMVLGFARLVKYRPGGVLVGMIPFFAIPVMLFNHYIGANQLEFRLLVHRYGPGSLLYSPIDISARVFQETLKDWKRYKVRDLQAIADLTKIEFPYVAQQMLQEDRCKILSVCDRFLAEYPRCRFVPNALYMQGLAMDMRFNYRSLLRNWAVEYTTDLVSPESASVWTRLVDQYSNSVYAQPARFRLAVLALREGKVAVAERLLRDLIDAGQILARKGPAAQVSEGTINLRDIFTEPPQTDVPAIDLPVLLKQAQELLELVRNNGNDPQFKSEPLAQFMRLDPDHPKYRDHLLELAINYSGSLLHDNLLVRYALTDPDPQQRLELLERYAEIFIGKDAGAEALFEVARLLQSWGLANMDTKAHDQAEDYYSLLIKQYPKSIFAAQAKLKLKEVQAISKLFYTKP